MLCEQRKCDWYGTTICASRSAQLSNCFENVAVSPQTEQAEASSLSDLLGALINAWDKMADAKNTEAKRYGKKMLLGMSSLRKGEGITYDICAEQLRNLIKSI